MPSQAACPRSGPDAVNDNSYSCCHSHKTKRGGSADTVNDNDNVSNNNNLIRNGSADTVNDNANVSNNDNLSRKSPCLSITYVNNICQCQLGIHYKYHSNHSSEQEAAVVTVVAHWSGGQWGWGSIPALHSFWTLGTSVKDNVNNNDNGAIYSFTEQLSMSIINPLK